jgi:transposase InsO family protein
VDSLSFHLVQISPVTSVERGRPAAIRCDNGPEFTSRHFLAWCVERRIELIHIQPGKPDAERARGKLSQEPGASSENG